MKNSLDIEKDWDKIKPIRDKLTTLHDTICSDCGEETQVPFKPIEGRPVYCHNCYRNHKHDV